MAAAARRNLDVGESASPIRYSWPLLDASLNPCCTNEPAPAITMQVKNVELLLLRQQRRRFSLSLWSSIIIQLTMLPMMKSMMNKASYDWHLFGISQLLLKTDLSDLFFMSFLSQNSRARHPAFLMATFMDLEMAL